MIVYLSYYFISIYYMPSNEELRRQRDEELRIAQARRLEEFNTIYAQQMQGRQRNITGLLTEPLLSHQIGPRSPAILAGPDRAPGDTIMVQPTAQDKAWVDLSNTHLDAAGNLIVNRDETFDRLARQYPGDQNWLDQIERNAHAINRGIDKIIDNWKSVFGGVTLSHAARAELMRIAPPNATEQEITRLLGLYKDDNTFFSFLKERLRSMVYTALVGAGNINRKMDKMITKYPLIGSCLAIGFTPRRCNAGDAYCKLGEQIKCASDMCCSTLMVYFVYIVSNALYDEFMRQLPMIMGAAQSRQYDALGGKRNTKKRKCKVNGKTKKGKSKSKSKSKSKTKKNNWV
jgi:hypothetical protein